MSGERILVVDDSPATGRLIKLYLENLGYEVAGTAVSAVQALTMLNDCAPSLVLMDINLGEGMSGIDAADVIRNEYHIPVIYVTAYSDDRTLERAKQSLPFGFINKPFRENDLRVNIEIALSRFANGIRDGAGGESANGNNQAGNPAVHTEPLSQALDHLVSGVIVVNTDLRVFYKNKSAARMLAGDSPVNIRNDSLLCSNTRTRKDLKNYIKKKTSIIFSLREEPLPLYCLIFPLNSPISEQARTPGGSILFLFETNRNTGQIEEVVRAMYKLSPTEARIAAQLVFNPYLADISTSLGITYNTARTHLKRIYQKTGTNKLPSLIQKIVTGPAGLLIHSAD